MVTLILFLWNLCNPEMVSAYVNPWFLKESNNPLLYPKTHQRLVPFVWNTTISLPEITTQKLLLAEPDYCVVSDTFQVPNMAKKDQDCYGPKFRFKLYPQGLLATEGSSSILSLQYLPDTKNEQPRYYYDTTFCIRWSSNNTITSEHFEWKGGRRFKGTLSEEEICPDALDIFTFSVEELPAFLDDVYPDKSDAVQDNEVGHHNNHKKKMELINLEAEITIHGSELIKKISPRTLSKVENSNEGNVLVSQKSSNEDPKWWKFWQNYSKAEYKEEESWLKTGFKAAQFHDVRTTKDPASQERRSDNSLRVGSVVIPLLSTQAEGILPESIERPMRILVSTLFSATVLGGSWVNVPSMVMKAHRSMWEKGVYPGIDYEITRIFNSPSESSSEEQELFYHQSNADYEVRPIYPLGPILERKWPVKINEADIPNLISPLQYNIATAIGALTASASILGSFFLVSLMTSLFFIPSRSMEPTLNVGDVLLVEKITPRVPFLNRYRPGDVVMFRPPNALRELVEANGGKLSNRDLFVKRVAAVAGDVVEVGKNGDVKVFNGVENRETPLRNLCDAEPLGLIKRYVKPGTMVVPPGRVLLLGDCSSVSVDGRVWGTLNTKEIVGRPIVRTWPPSKMHKIADLPTAESQWAE